MGQDHTACLKMELDRYKMSGFSMGMSLINLAIWFVLELLPLLVVWCCFCTL